MRSSISRVGAVLAALALLPLAYAATSSAQAGTVFEVYPGGPVVSHGPGGAWDDKYTDPGAVFYHNGMYHMFRNGFRNWPATVQIGYVTSPDGYTWTKQGDQPVFTTAQVPYAGTAILASSVLVRDDGTWVLYFSTYGDGPGASWAIGRATAPGPTGPWTADPAPILKPGSPGSWDERSLSTPSVLRTESGYVMYYGGYSAGGFGMVGMATSTDGISWTRYNDPSTGGAYAESDPVLRPGPPDAWDQESLERPHVQHTPDGWVMLYRAGKGADSNIDLGYALSSDGINWTRSENNPVLRPNTVSGGWGIYNTNLVYQDGTYFIYWEVGRGSGAGVSDIFLATHKGALPTGRVAQPTATPREVPTSPPGVSPTSTPGSVPTVPVPGSGSRSFTETGKSVSGLFLNYWDGHGGLAQQGFPISGVVGEVSDLNGKPYTVQYFERAVFEYHPELQAPFNVLLSQLGTFQYKKKYPNGAPGQKPNGEAGSTLFQETGKRVGGKFLAYWKAHGGLAQQGFPISDEFTEVSDLNGKPYTVQYFERAVFELHPENPQPYDVLLSQLGTFQYKARYGAK